MKSLIPVNHCNQCGFSTHHTTYYGTKYGHNTLYFCNELARRKDKTGVYWCDTSNGIDPRCPFLLPSDE